MADAIFPLTLTLSLRQRFRRIISHIEPLNRSAVGRVTPCAPALGDCGNGAHGVTRPTLRFMEREQHGTSAKTFHNCSYADRLATILPLPKGEGRGEGEANIAGVKVRDMFTRFPTKES